MHHWENPWFREEFDDDREDFVLVFRTRKRFEEFKYYLKEELNGIPLTIAEQEYYRANIIEFARDQVPIIKLAPKQEIFLKSMEDMKNRKIILLTPRGGSKTMLDALVSVWSCGTFPRYFQTVLGGAFNQTKALSQQAATFLYDNPRLALLLSKPPGLERIEFLDGSLILSLKASETSARSPHPSGLMLDEYVVMRPEIVTAARGQLAETALGYYRHGRLIITSTAQMGPSITEFKEIFMDGWKVFDEPKPPHNWNRFLSFNWSLSDCTWRTEDEMQEILYSKETMSEEEFAVEYDGKFGTATGSIFRDTDIDYIEVNAQEPYYEYKSPSYPTYIGVDWGFSINPTVVLLLQKHSDGIIRVLDMESGLKVDFDYWLDIIEDWCKEYNVVAINADASHIGENLRLKKRGLPISSISFAGKAYINIAGKVKHETFKDIMLDNIQWIVQKHLIEVHPSFNKLIKEMKKYQWMEQKDTPKKKPIKKGVDHVEALQLALLNLREGGYVSTPMSAVAQSTVLSASSKTYSVSDARFDPSFSMDHVVARVVGGTNYKKQRKQF